MATGRIPTTANSPLTAKGDLFTFSTGSAKLAVGNNGETLVADSSTSTGLRYKEDYAAGKNKIINGDFGVWQRGTSFTPTLSAATYTSDRWNIYVDGTGGTRTVSRQTFTPGTAPVSGYEGSFFLRYDQSVAGSGTGNNILRHFIESVRTYAGQTVTLSFWAKAAASTSLTIELQQYFGSGGSPSSSVFTTVVSGATIGTSWTRYTYTINNPSISSKTIGTNNDDFLGVRFLVPTGSAFTFDIWGVQLEESSVATAFQTATGTIQGELAACQRYYWRAGAQIGGAYGVLGTSGYTSLTTASQVMFVTPVRMRITPTVLDYSAFATTRILNWGAGFTPTAASIAAVVSTPDVVWVEFTSSGMTALQFSQFSRNNDATAFIGFSAEL